MTDLKKWNTLRLSSGYETIEGLCRIGSCLLVSLRLLWERKMNYSCSLHPPKCNTTEGSNFQLTETIDFFFFFLSSFFFCPDWLVCQRKYFLILETSWLVLATVGWALDQTLDLWNTCARDDLRFKWHSAQA